MTNAPPIFLHPWFNHMKPYVDKVNQGHYITESEAAQQIRINNNRNSNQYLIVSGATKGSEYVECLDKQAEYFKDHNYMSFIVEDRGNWNENTKIKTEVVRKAFEYSSEVLWVDADSLLIPPSNNPEDEFDVGIFDNINPEHRARISATYIYFRDTPNTRCFLDVWDGDMSQLPMDNTDRNKDHPALLTTIKVAGSFILPGIQVKNINYWIEGREDFNGLLPERGRFIGSQYEK